MINFEATMKSDVLSVNGVQLAFDTFGRDDAPAILLMMGNSAPGIVWPEAFCQALAAAGFRVIRYDQRDTGFSTYLDFDKNPYTLCDLVEDAVSLLEGLGIQAAHFVGLSQGGNTALLAGLHHPSRVASITTLMSSPDLGPKNDAFMGLPERIGQLPRPDMAYVNAVIDLNSAPTRSDEDAADRFMRNFKLAAGPKSPFDQEFWMELGRAVTARRNGDPAKMANHSNHSKAQKATAGLTEDDLRRLAKPCLVIQGEMDPIFPTGHTEWAAANLPDAQLCIIPNMGHALDPAFFEPVASRIRTFLRSRQ